MSAEVRPDTTTPAVQRQPLQKINKDAGENFSDFDSAWFGVIFSLRGAFVSCGDKKTMYKIF